MEIMRLAKRKRSQEADWHLKMMSVQEVAMTLRASMMQERTLTIYRMKDEEQDKPEREEEIAHMAMFLPTVKRFPTEMLSPSKVATIIQEAQAETMTKFQLKMTMEEINLQRHMEMQGHPLIWTAIEKMSLVQISEARNHFQDILATVEEPLLLRQDMRFQKRKTTMELENIPRETRT